MSRSEIEKILIEKNYTCNNSDIKSTMCNIGKGTGKPNVVLLHDNQKHNHTVNIDNHKFPVHGTTIYAYCGFINSCYKSSETLKNSLVEKFKNLRCVEVDLKKHSSLQSFWYNEYGESFYTDEYTDIHTYKYGCRSKSGIMLFIANRKEIWLFKNRYLNENDKKRLEKIKKDKIDFD